MLAYVAPKNTCLLDMMLKEAKKRKANNKDSEAFFSSGLLLKVF